MNENMNANDWTFKTTALAILAMLGLVSKNRTNVMLDITCNADGSFDRHFGTLKPNKPATVLAFLKSACKALASGDFSGVSGIDAEHVAKKLKSCRQTSIPTTQKDMLAYLSAVAPGRAVNINLHRYLKDVNASQNFVGRGNMTKTQAREARKAQSPAAVTPAVDAAAILAELLQKLQG